METNAAPIGYGAVRLAIVSIRRLPAHRAEQVTQLLFGERYEVLQSSDNGGWIYIQASHDGYQGWMDAKQHDSLERQDYEQLGRSKTLLILSLTAMLHREGRTLIVPMGTALPLHDAWPWIVEGETKLAGDRVGGFQFLRRMALRYLGVPYLWGGRTPFGIDCSGFTQAIFGLCGYVLPRDSAQQAHAGRAIAQVDTSIPGDLAFFSEEERGHITHVGLILNKKEIIHASGCVRIDRWTKEGVFNITTGRRSHVLVALRRILI